VSAVRAGLPRLGLACLGLVLLADQASKWAAVAWLHRGQTVHVWGNFYLTYVHNPGGAFSLLADAPGWVRHPLFLSVTVCALWVGYRFWQSLPSGDRLSEFALGLVGGGALGNQVDRLRLGEVIDFFHVDIPTGWLQWAIPSLDNPYTWPIFNVADSAVCAGIALLAWRVFRPCGESDPHAS
jgi:signal peptidase II